MLVSLPWAQRRVDPWSSMSQIPIRIVKLKTRIVNIYIQCKRMQFLLINQ